MIDRQIQVLLDQAEVQRRLGNDGGAIELAQRALTLDPDHGYSHAVLANLLLQARRVPGAAIEIQLALGLDADDEFTHRVAARIRIAQRDLDDAWAHCLLALQGDRPTAAAHVLGAEIQQLRGDNARARELLDQALALEPESTSALTELGRLELSLGGLDACGRAVEQALKIEPSHRGAHVLAGRLALQRGDVAGAERHARFVLGQRATDLGALQLWAAIQSRQSWALGLWWRWHSWIVLRSDRARIAFMLASFVLIQLIVIVADDSGLELTAVVVRMLWLAFCAYTWVAPARFRRMVEDSLGTVHLDPEF